MKKKMLKQSILFVTALLLGNSFLTSCSKDDTEDLIGNWVQVGIFTGIPRTDAVAFTIGDYAYVGTGYSYENNEDYKDFWRFDPTSNTWDQIESLPETAPTRSQAIAFSSSTHGYVGLGYSMQTKDALSDFYQYDPIANEWTAKKDFEGGKRYSAISFYVDGKGYAGTGYDKKTNKTDFYQYDTENDTWIKKADVAGLELRRDAMSFVLNNEAYVVGGVGNSFVEEFVKYDVTNNKWITLRNIVDTPNESYDDDYTSIARYNGVAFTINGKAYVSIGNGVDPKSTWEFDPTTDLWKEKTSFDGDPRTGAITFTLKDVTYVGLGGNAGSSKSYYDMWTFKPNDEYQKGKY